MCEIRAFVTNLGAYNSGELIGEWADFPINDDDLGALMHRIGVVKDYSPEERSKIPEAIRSLASEELFLTDWETDFPALHDAIGEYTSIKSLNDIAEELEDLDEHDAEIVSAIMQDQNCGVEDAKEALNDGWFLPCDPDDDSDIGYQLAENFDTLAQIPENLQSYFDYEKYGRDFTLESSYVAVSDGLFIYD